VKLLVVQNMHNHPFLVPIKGLFVYRLAVLRSSKSYLNLPPSFAPLQLSIRKNIWLVFDTFNPQIHMNVREERDKLQIKRRQEISPYGRSYNSGTIIVLWVHAWPVLKFVSMHRHKETCSTDLTWDASRAHTHQLRSKSS